MVQIPLSNLCWSPRTDSNMVHSTPVCEYMYVQLGCPNTDWEVWLHNWASSFVTGKRVTIIQEDEFHAVATEPLPIT